MPEEHHMYNEQLAATKLFDWKSEIHIKCHATTQPAMACATDLSDAFI